ncbi:glycosyltransferase family 2 protein, partial [Patescibacteria group bacterium]|nr:glycosyltransferase family 2 protein [Patescibacteria group bacterium]
MSDRPSLLPVSICIIAYNEEAHIASCLDSVADRAAEVVVLNAESTDKTAEIVERYRQKYPGVVLMTAPNTFKYNINKMKTFHKATQPWIFYLDADERLTPELWDEIGDVIETDRYDGYLVGRKNFYFGKWMRFGGMYPEKQPRLFRQGKGSFSLEHVHATLDIDGPVGELEQPFLH